MKRPAEPPLALDALRSIHRARDPATPPATLAELLDHHDPAVRAAAARNEALPMQALAAAVREGNLAAFCNPALPLYALADPAADWWRQGVLKALGQVEVILLKLHQPAAVARPLDILPLRRRIERVHQLRASLEDVPPDLDGALALLSGLLR